jgi:hypothetical protein
MTRRTHVERIEIPVEDLTDTGRCAATDREAGGDEDGAGGSPGTAHVATAEPAPRPIGDMGSSFRRLEQLPGAQLAVALDAWWQRGDHGDDHLRLEQPHRDAATWTISGMLRHSVVTRWIPVELVLSPYAERFTLLEMSPQRAVRASPGYFRAGQRALDRFVGAVRTECSPAGIVGPQPGGSAHDCGYSSARTSLASSRSTRRPSSRASVPVGVIE